MIGLTVFPCYEFMLLKMIFLNIFIVCDKQMKWKTAAKATTN